MNTNTLLIGVIAGAFGTGYFIYGKKEQMIVPTLSGIMLCLYPYFTDNMFILCGIGITLIIVPFFLKF